MAISRIDQPEKRTHGYYVRVTRHGKTQAKFFPDKTHGGKRAALKAAKEHEAELHAWAAAQKPRPRKPSSRNTSGVVGVNRTAYNSGSTLNEYWQAEWTDSDGRRRSAKYSINKYGEDKAKRLAIKARREGLRAKEAQS